KTLSGVFDDEGLPYEIDRKRSVELTNTIPTLAEMTEVAIKQMKDHAEVFVLQVESGKVDCASHAYDVAALMHQQLQSDESVAIAMKFTKQDRKTLVVLTTDHGNANPGMIYGKYADDHFDSLADYKYTNEYILNSIKADYSEFQIKDFVKNCINVD